ncbi:MAG: PorV/PorQ family protein [Ignavibacteriales bacterium]|nr:PorV/PorQ family protein [Ignavibacteriales bacterium]
MNCFNKSIYSIIGTFFMMLVRIHAQSGIPPTDIERVGQSGWQFLKINGDPRQASMGGAFTAISKGDASAVFGNPAALSDVQNYNVQFNILQWVADISHQSAAFALNLGDVGVVGASIAMLDYGDIPETINAPSGTNGTSPLVTGNMFTANDVAAGVSYARKITDNLSVGGNVRWVQQQIAELSMHNWSLDFGTMYYTGFRSLRIAITARNFGPDSRFGGWSEEYQTESDNIRMPLDFRAGIAMDFFDDSDGPHLMTVVVEGDHPNDGKEKFHIGTSYCFDSMFFVRGGYKFNYDVQRFTFGAGINYVLGETVVSVHYAYVDFSELTQAHMFSVGFSY